MPPSAPTGASAIIVSDCFPDERSYRRALPSGRAVYANILWGVERHAAGLGVARRGLRFHFGPIPDMVRGNLGHARGGHIILIPEFRPWANDVETLGNCIDALREQSDALITLVDLADQPGSPYLGLLGQVDRLLKGQLSRDRNLYVSSPCAGSAFAAWCQETYGWSMGPHSFQSHADPAHLGKLQVGWTFGCVPFFSRLALIARLAAPRLAQRRIHVHARFSAAPLGPADSPDYYTRYRSVSAAAVRRLSPTIKATPPTLVNRWQFYRELFNSQIVFSPFGWGEVCFRDYEAAAAGCVLLKPSMAHLDTRPAIYKEHVTYVPVRWDLADLESQIDWVLTHPSDAAQIAQNLRVAYRDSLRRLSDATFPIL